jgi:hypothetical protein
MSLPRGYVGNDVGGVLARGEHAELHGFNRFFGHGSEHCSQALGLGISSHQARTKCHQGAPRQIGIAGRQVQRTVPPQVEGELVERLLIRKIQHLLEQHDAKHAGDAPVRAPILGVQVPETVLDRQQ